MFRSITALSLVAAALALSGCGGSSKLYPVEGTVTMDGTPVEGAAVTFIADDGKKTFAGQTDASGKYTIYSGEKPGATAGTYKVLVTKAKKIEGDMTPGGADYTKQMSKMNKEAAALNPAGDGKGPFMPSTGKAVTGPKGELPAMYSAASTTPFTATVPASGPVDFALTTPKGGKK
jgi:hypothetical protein